MRTLIILCVLAALLVVPSYSVNSCCLEETKVGPCRASFPRWTYNRKKRRCVLFIWGGLRR
ncbi:hypothetical protein MRX96_013374 [Rhipicephalus microplus]